ncbi:hypothetical protein S83_043805, partial [Arachis hypogaea]
MVISEKWCSNKKDNIGKDEFATEKILKVQTRMLLLFHLVHEMYYSHQWLREDPTRTFSRQDIEITNERVKCLKRYFLMRREEK